MPLSRQGRCRVFSSGSAPRQTPQHISPWQAPASGPMYRSSSANKSNTSRDTRERLRRLLLEHLSVKAQTPRLSSSPSKQWLVLEWCAMKTLSTLSLQSSAIRWPRAFSVLSCCPSDPASLFLNQLCAHDADGVALRSKRTAVATGREKTDRLIDGVAFPKFSSETATTPSGYVFCIHTRSPHRPRLRCSPPTCLRPVGSPLAPMNTPAPMPPAAPSSQDRPLCVPGAVDAGMRRQSGLGSPKGRPDEPGQ